MHALIHVIIYNPNLIKIRYTMLTINNNPRSRHCLKPICLVAMCLCSILAFILLRIYCHPISSFYFNGCQNVSLNATIIMCKKMTIDNTDFCLSSSLSYGLLLTCVLSIMIYSFIKTHLPIPAKCFLCLSFVLAIITAFTNLFLTIRKLEEDFKGQLLELIILLNFICIICLINMFLKYLFKVFHYRFRQTNSQGNNLELEELV